MLGNYQPPAGPDSPLIDPETQKLIDEYRQQQLIQQLAGQQEAGGRTPQNLGEGYRALGQGAIAMLQGFKARSDAERQAALMGRIASAFGGGGSGIPMPKWSAPSGMTGTGALSSASPIKGNFSLTPESHPRYAGELSVGDQTYNFASGGAGRGSSPPGDRLITGYRGGPLGGGEGRFTTSNVFDPQIGDTRGLVQIHAGRTDDLDKLRSAGCFAVPPSQWPSLKANLIDQMHANGGQLTLHIGNDGFASVVPGGMTADQVQDRAQDATDSRKGLAAYGAGADRLAPYRAGIASIESAGSGGYQAVNSKTGAAGKYQVMPANVGPWTRDVLGQPMSTADFLANPQAQDAVFNSKFGGLLDKYGPEGAASAWYTGKPGSPAAAPYVAKLASALNGPASYGVPPGQVAGGNAVPANLPPPIEGRSVARPSQEGPGTAMAPLTPLAEPQSPISPVPIQRGVPQPFVPGVPVGAQQGFTPGAPPAAGGPPSPAAVPMPPVRPATPSQVPAVPPAGIPRPAGGGPGGAPPGTHWAQLPGPPLLLADNQDAATAGGGGQATSPGLLAQLFGGSAQAVPIRAPGGPALAGGLSGQPRAVTGGPVPPTAQPQPQQAQAAPSSGDQYFDNLVQQHSYAMDQAARYSQGAAAAFNTPLAAQYADKAKMWESIAEKRVEEANAFILKRQENSPTEITTLPDKSQIITNKITHQKVGDFAPAPEEKDIEKVTDYKTYKADQESRGQPVLSYGEYTHQGKEKGWQWVANAGTNNLGQPTPGWVRPPDSDTQSLAKPETATSGLTDEQKTDLGEPAVYKMPDVGSEKLQMPTIQLTKEQHDALERIPEERRGMVLAILQNDMKLPPVTGKGAGGALGGLLNHDIRTVVPNFDAQNQQANVKAKSEFLSGGPNSYAKQIEFGNTGINHLADYTSLSDKADKVAGWSEGPLSYVVGGPTAQEIGAGASGRTTAGKGALDALRDKADTFAGEFTKYLTGAEGTLEERNRKAGRLTGDLPTHVRKMNVLSALNSIEGRKAEIEAAWHNANGPLVQDFPVLSKQSQASMDRIRKWATTGPGAVTDPALVNSAAPSTAAESDAQSASGAIPTVSDPGEARRLYQSGTKVRLPDGRIGTVP